MKNSKHKTNNTHKMNRDTFEDFRNFDNPFDPVDNFDTGRQSTTNNFSNLRDLEEKNNDGPDNLSYLKEQDSCPVRPFQEILMHKNKISRDTNDKAHSTNSQDIFVLSKPRSDMKKKKKKEESENVQNLSSYLKKHPFREKESTRIDETAQVRNSNKMICSTTADINGFPNKISFDKNLERPVNVEQEKRFKNMSQPLSISGDTPPPPPPPPPPPGPPPPNPSTVTSQSKMSNINSKSETSHESNLEKQVLKIPSNGKIECSQTSIKFPSITSDLAPTKKTDVTSELHSAINEINTKGTKGFMKNLNRSSEFNGESNNFSNNSQNKIPSACKPDISCVKRTPPPLLPKPNKNITSKYLENQKVSFLKDSSFIKQTDEENDHSSTRYSPNVSSHSTNFIKKSDNISTKTNISHETSKKSKDADVTSCFNSKYNNDKANFDNEKTNKQFSALTTNYCDSFLPPGPPPPPPSSTKPDFRKNIQTSTKVSKDLNSQQKTNLTSQSSNNYNSTQSVFANSNSSILTKNNISTSSQNQRSFEPQNLKNNINEDNITNNKADFSNTSQTHSSTKHSSSTKTFLGDESTNFTKKCTQQSSVSTRILIRESKHFSSIATTSMSCSNQLKSVNQISSTLSNNIHSNSTKLHQNEPEFLSENTTSDNKITEQFNLRRKMFDEMKDEKSTFTRTITKVTNGMKEENQTVKRINLLSKSSNLNSH